VANEKEREKNITVVTESNLTAGTRKVQGGSYDKSAADTFGGGERKRMGLEGGD